VITMAAVPDARTREDRIVAVRRRIARLAAWLAVVSMVTFAPVVRFAFVYDDQWTIVRNRSLTWRLQPLLAAVFGGTARTLGVPDATRPTMIASSWIDRHLFGLRPTAWHAHSLLLYGVCCALAFLLARRFARNTTAAIVAGLVFAFAPIHAEAVAAINYREDLLASMFASIFLLACFRRRSEPASAFEATLASVALLFGLLAKESALVVVILAPALAWCTRDVGFARRNERTLFGGAAVICLWLNWRLAVMATADDIPRASFAGPMARLLATARYEVQATMAAIVPIFWAPERSREQGASAWWLLPLLAIAVAIVVLARARRTRPFGIGLAFAAIAPLASSPLVGPANAFTDRYLFLSTLGGALVWGAAAAELQRRWPRIGVPWLALATLPLALVALQAAQTFRDDRTLWTVATERAPGSPRAWTGLSRVHRLGGDLESADRAVARALSIDPTYLPAHLTRAYDQLARGEVIGARAELDYLARAGGPPLPGYRRALECASLTPAGAQSCIAATP
jgi:hypothetical protein